MLTYTKVFIGMKLKCAKLWKVWNSMNKYAKVYKCMQMQTYANKCKKENLINLH